MAATWINCGSGGILLGVVAPVAFGTAERSDFRFAVIQFEQELHAAACTAGEGLTDTYATRPSLPLVGPRGTVISVRRRV